MVLSYMPPDLDDVPPAPAGEADESAATLDWRSRVGALHGPDPRPSPEPADVEPADEKPADAKPAGEKATGDKPPAVVDENAPRLEVSAPAYVDAGKGSSVTVTVTATNAGHRPMVAAIRARLLGFRIEGPDGVVHCMPGAPTRAVPREGFQTLRPGGSTSLTVLVEEACGRAVFGRPGLYKMTPSLHLVEPGPDLVAFTGHAKAREPTLVRIATGPEPFYVVQPKALRAPGHEPGEAPGP
jgi:hypothetical protein